ncbi:hypothetical protein V2K48_20185 [Pseudomonas alliivorans]|nr:hypothetical protein [Pseudomonas alliivorans]MEE4926896.1 hypothetical protein [Pseudomonas alliivorans]
MSKAHRDNFTAKVKNALALRAGYRCAFTGCGVATSGPSDEASDKHVSIGVAAHITAAAPGGERHDSTMSTVDRAAIDNGIWLCQTHSRLIDVNSVAYPVSTLLQMKADHELAIKAEMERMRSVPQHTDFIAVGPNIVFVGEIIGVEEDTWSFSVGHFFIGDLSHLIRYIDQYAAMDSYDKYVLVNSIGDGRELTRAPVWTKSGNDFVLKLCVKVGFPRIDAHRIPMDLALSDEHDLFITNGQFARVSGLDALPQKIKTCLSTIRGEVFNAPAYGTRIREYSQEFLGSPWLPKLIKLECIRMAAIPYEDSNGLSPPSTPLKAVRRVINVDQISSVADGSWLTFNFDLEVEGVGPWAAKIKLLIL